MRFICRILLAFIASAMFLSAFVFAGSSDVSAKPTELPSGISISYYSDIYSRCFVWHTGAGIRNTVLRIAEAASAATADFRMSQVISGSCTSYVCSGGTANLHCATVEGLLPGRTYAYKLGDGAGNDVTGVFTVSSGTDPLTVLTLADTKSEGADKTVLKSTLAAAADIASPDLITIAGDLICRNSDATNTFYCAASTFDLISARFGSACVALSPGDCDSEVSGLYTVAGSCDADYGVSEKFCYSGKRPSSGGSYCVAYGDALFVVIDTNSLTQKNLLKEIQRIKSMLSSDYNWKIVIMHDGVYSSSSASRSSTDKIFYKQLDSVFKSCGANLVISGHDLSYSQKVREGTGEGGSANVGGREYCLYSGSTYYVTLGAAGNTGTDNTSVFGVLDIDEYKLRYDIYSVKDGKSSVIDTVSVYKSDLENLAAEIDSVTSENNSENCAELLYKYSALCPEEKLMVSEEVLEKIRQAEASPRIVRLIEEKRFAKVAALSGKASDTVSLCRVQNSCVSGGQYCVRFIASTGASDFSGCGFIINAEYSGNEKTLGGYSDQLMDVAEANGQIITSYSAEELECEHLFAYTVCEIPISIGTVSFYVTPFVIYGGEITYGDSFCIVYCEGYFRLISVSDSR